MTPYFYCKKFSSDKNQPFIQAGFVIREGALSNNCWSFEQWLVFENGIWNTTQTRFHILPAQSKHSEQTSLSVSREIDKQWRIRQV